MFAAVTAWLAVPGLIIWLIILLLPWRPWSTRESLDAAAPDSLFDHACITVLIPARNEAESISATLDGLAAQNPQLKIILIDDQSTDQTAVIAKNKNLPNLTIISGQPLPEGWAGKLWALEQGRKLVTTELTLLLDADIQLLPGTLAALIRKLDEDNRDLVSLMARLRMESFWEKLLMPAFIFFFKLLYPFSLANSTSRWIAAAAGGCILVKTATLENAGAFAGLKQALIDDCTLARKIKDNGGRIWLGLTHSAVSLRPYDTLGIIWEMVARSAFTQLYYSWGLFVLCTLLMLAIFLLPVVALFSGNAPATFSAALTLFIMCICYLPVLRYYHLHPAWVISLPITGLLYLGMTWTSALRHMFSRGARWKGREYTRTARK